MEQYEFVQTIVAIANYGAIVFLVELDYLHVLNWKYLIIVDLHP